MVQKFRYSMWDGTQEVPEVAPDEILDNLTDDLMNFGDLQHALRNMMQRGMKSPNGQRQQGLRDLLQQLRQQRRQQLDKFDLSSVFDDLKQKLDEIVDMENNTIDRRLDEATGNQGQQGEQQSGPQNQQGGEQGQQQQGQQGGEQDGAPQQQGQRGSQSPQGQRSQNQQGGQQPGQQQAGGQEPGGEPDENGSPMPSNEFAEMLKNIANRKKDFLQNLPEDVAGQVKQLQNYEFMDPEAQAKFNELLESLKKAMMDTFFKDMYNQIANMSPEDMARMKNLMQDLNQMLQDKMAGKEPNFDQFMQQYGDMFGDNPPQNLDDLIQQMQHQMGQMQSLMDSMPSDLRSQLQELLSDKIGDSELQQMMSDVAQNLEYLYPMRDLKNQYPFRGEEQLDLESAMQLMDQMQSIDELERQIERTQYGGDVEDIDADKLEDLLGPEARETLDQLKKFMEILEDAGYIRKKGNGYELTPRGTRKIGQRALVEIYQSLKKDSFGKHEIRESGQGGDRTDITKQYEFGDPFHLHIQKTMFNSMLRNGPGTPIKIGPQDFEVDKTELLTQTSTVIMLDLSGRWRCAAASSRRRRWRWR